MTLAQYKVNNPLLFQPIVREIGLGENVEGNTIPISPPPWGLATEVSSIPEGQNIRGKIASVHPPTRELPVKLTTTTNHYRRIAQTSGNSSGGNTPRNVK